jgi:hypothetical protein
MAHWLFTFGGIAMVAFGLWEKYKHKETAKWMFWGFAVLLLLVAFYQAWLDEHHNTAVVIAEKATAVGDWGTCNGDLKAETEKNKLLDRQNIQQQTTINSQQSSLNSQQDSVNKCIVQLGSAIKPERLKTEAWLVGTVIEKTDRQSPFFGSWVVLTNKTVTPIRLLVTCDGDIAGAAGEVLGTGVMAQGRMGWEIFS